MMKRRDSYSTGETLKALDKSLGMAIGQWLQNSSPMDLWQTCATCSSATKKGPMFCEKFKVVPPVRIIVGAEACAHYHDDEEIPF